MRQHSMIIGLAALCALSAPAGAQVPGGGPAKTDCYVEWSGITPNKGKNLDCQDGDPSCDVDGTQNGVCVLGVGVCVAQTNVPECTPQQIDKVTVKANPKTVKLGSVKIPVTPPVPPIVPITAPTCSAESIIRLPLKVTKKGTFKPSTKITLTATAIADWRESYNATASNVLESQARLLPLELDPSIKQGRSRLPASAVTEARLVRITFLLF
jgi:hypothetical protein